MVVTFVVPVFGHPYGGTTGLYEFAGGLRRRGHTVHVLHINLSAKPLATIDEIDWFEFEPGIDHHLARPDDWQLPDADVLANPPHPGIAPRHGRPVIFVQGHGIFPQFEDAALREPCPKICVARWLVEVGKRLGVPDDELIHVPYGLKHTKYRLRSPIADRPPQVAVCYNSHLTKGLPFAFEALAEVKARVRELRVVVFGTDVTHPIPRWMTYREAPPQSVIVDDIYNQSRIFVSASLVEGFGLACVEAMACGCALVTTANGGSADYAIHDRTALVSEPRDVGMMADHVESLLADDARRVRIATEGRTYVQRFDWDRSAELLESFLERYRSGAAR